MCDRIFRNHVAVYPNAFAKRDQVRRREQSGAISLCATNRIDHGTNGALTIGSSDVNDLARNGGFGVAEADLKIAPPGKSVEQALDVFQAELDPEALQAVKPGERFMVR